MRRYSEAVKADVKRRMSPPHRQKMAQISEELGIHVVTFYNWRKASRLQGEAVTASEMKPIHPLWHQPEVVWVNKPPDELTTTPAVPLAQAA